MSIVFKIIRNGSDFSCSADNGPNFFVGRQTTYKTRVGLFNIFSGSKLTKLLYNSENYTGEHQFWARFIDPTAGCEGRSFLTLNTYDRAAFTFGFSQFAAHVPDGDFVRYFRAMLALPEADDYFPGLTLVDGRIARRADNGTTTLLETKNDTTPLMRYLNPSSDGVEDAEVIAAAKLIHWTTAQRSARLLQIKQMIETYRGFMREADRRKLIDGRPAAQCCVIADILHQGRGTWAEIATALKTSTPFEKLVAIGAPEWKTRRQQLRAGIAKFPEMQTLTWRSSAQDFV
ncbi:MULTISPECIES: hypothetical protein [Sphingomonas]|uniref:hypothetical protein n=1 Tax=Sphingomonas TaxID=13687 RepID=UPI00082AD847|nr:hypothetical protein [Sphingomonas sp. CCH10-B3]